MFKTIMLVATLAIVHALAAAPALSDDDAQDAAYEAEAVVVSHLDAIERADYAAAEECFSESFRIAIKPRVRCASGTDYSDGAAIHQAVRQQQHNALLAWPGKVRRNRTDVEWASMYEAAMNAKAAAIADRLFAGGALELAA